MGEEVQHYHLEFRVESGCLGLNLGSNAWWLHGGELFAQPNFAVGFPGGSGVKNPPANSRDVDSIPGSEDPQEKETATHSSTFVWRIPWTEETGRLQSMGSQRVRHD